MNGITIENTYRSPLTKKLVSLVVFLLFAIVVLFAQSMEQQALLELDKLGLDDEQVREKLLERGIDVDNINIQDPNAVFELEKNLQEVIAEIEAERANANDTEGTGTENESIFEGDELNQQEGSKQEDFDPQSAKADVAEQLADLKKLDLPTAKVYGQEIFRNQSIQVYTQSQDVKPPQTYILGVGDIIGVSIWGYSEEDVTFEINQDGYIKPRSIPRIYLKGLQLKDAKELLERRFSNYYRFDANQFEVTLNYGRTVNVNIVGEVFNYGTYNLPAINSPFNALVAAGGPNDIGSVRNIQLIKLGGKKVNLDVYEYLQNPSYTTDFNLEEGDVIYVPIAEKHVSIAGAVIRPYKYELKESEDLVELLEFCGGLKVNASFKNIQLKRIDNGVEKIIDLDLNQLLEDNENYGLQNGDEIMVREISESFKNFVSIDGAVEFPGDYEVGKNTKLSEVLAKANLLDDAWTDVLYVQRMNTDEVTSQYLRLRLSDILENPNSPDNIILRQKDKIQVYRQSRFVDNENFSITGAVRAGGEMAYDFSEELRLEDAIIMAGGLQKYATDFAYLQRKDPNDVERVIYQRLAVDEALFNPSGPENIVIQPGDKIVVYDQNSFVDQKTVSITGAVRNPGEFSYDPSLTIQDLITLSGGLTFSASDQRVDVFRLSLGKGKRTETLVATISLDENNQASNGPFKLQAFDQVVVREAPEFETIKTINIAGEVKYPGVYALLDDNEKISSVIERAGGVTEEAFLDGGLLFRSVNDKGYVAVNMKTAMANMNSSQNIILMAGDKLMIPKREELVTIQGATKASEMYVNEIIEQGSISVPFEGGKSAKYYIDKYAGGLADNGDKMNVTVTYPNGTIQKTKRFLFFMRYPKVNKGSVIYVGIKPQKEVKAEIEKEPINWGAFARDTLAAVTSVVTLIVLLQRIE